MATYSSRPRTLLRLSITQRLTLTSALLTAGVLLPAGVTLYLVFSGSTEREAVRTAQNEARAIADSFFQQWNDDLFIQFEGEGEFFQDSKIDSTDWAVIRPNGLEERTSGLFNSELGRVVAPSSRLVRSRSDKILRIASVPLIQTHTLRIEDLPEAAREDLSRASPRRVFLRGKRVVLSGQSLFEVLALEENQLLELKVRPDGKVEPGQPKPLPKTLPSDLVKRIMDLDSYTFDSISWAAYAGQLIAIVRRKMPRGGTFEAAVNRLGERFSLNTLGEVTGPEPDWMLHVSVALDASNEVVAKRALSLALCIGGPLTWIAMVLGGLYVARKAMSPVQDIVEAVQGIEPTQLGQRLPVQGVNDELSRIAATINGMLDRIERGYKRERRFTGDASHELRTPLAKVIAEIDLALLRGRENAEYLTALTRCRGYAQTMQRLVESLLMLARLDGQRGAIVWNAFDMAEVALQTVHAIPVEEATRVAVDLGESRDPLVALGERNLIEILLRNLVENALRYSPPERPVKLAILREGHEISVRIEDEGPGIPDEQVNLVFERFYRLDASRSRDTGGVGLGLSIARAIGQLHRTQVKLEKRATRGTLATFSLPAANGESPPGTETPR